MTKDQGSILLRAQHADHPFRIAVHRVLQIRNNNLHGILLECYNAVLRIARWVTPAHLRHDRQPGVGPMVVMWCKVCGALLGVREPLPEWTSDRNNLCPACSEKACPACREKASGKPTTDNLPASGDTADDVPARPTDA